MVAFLLSIMSALALSGHPSCHCTCPLLGGKRTSADISCCSMEPSFSPYQNTRLSRYDAAVLSLGADMRRREVHRSLGGAAAAWPLAARAQQSNQPRRIGVLMGFAESDPEAQSDIAAFRQSLQKLGWTGGNVRIAYRWVAGDDPA